MLTSLGIYSVVYPIMCRLRQQNVVIYNHILFAVHMFLLTNVPVRLV